MDPAIRSPRAHRRAARYSTASKCALPSATVSRPWVLVLNRPNGDPLRSVGGLTLALRLALDAQRAGASKIVCPEGSGVPRQALDDGRLRIPVVPDADEVDRVEVPASFLVHRAVLAAPKGGRVVIEAGRAAEPPAAYAFPAIDVVDARTARAAERALFRSLRKPEDGWTSRYLNRHVSLTISRWLVRTPLAPNQLSIAILAVGLLGAWLAARGTYESLVLGAFLFQMQSILDGCDGEMSRVTHRGSLLGEWLDTIGDDVTNYGFFAGASLGMYARTESSIPLIAGALTVGAGVTTSLIEYRYLWKIGSGDLLKYPTSRATNEGTGPFAAILPLFKRDTFVLLTFVAALLDQVGPMLVVFALAAVGILLNVLSAELRMARERTRG